MTTILQRWVEDTHRPAPHGLELVETAAGSFSLLTTQRGHVLTREDFKARTQAAALAYARDVVMLERLEGILMQPVEA